MIMRPIVPFHRVRFLACLALPGLVIALTFGCGGDPGDAAPDETGSMEESANEVTPEPAEPGMGTDEITEHTVQLAAIDDSGVSGDATGMLTEDALVVMIEVEGLPAEGEYAVHIHNGTCAEGGQVAVALDPVIGLSDGTGASTTTLEPDEIDQSTPHFVQVVGEGGTPVACGDMESPEG